MKNLRYLYLLVIPALFGGLTSCENESVSGVSADPTSVGQGGSLARFAVVKDYLYTVNGTELKVFNLNDPTNPIWLSNYQLNVDVETIFPRDSTTLFIGTTNGLYIYDITNPPNVKQLSFYSHVVSCDPVVANSQYAYVTLRTDENNNFCRRGVNRLDIVDIQDLTNPDIVNTFGMIKPYGLGLYADTLLVCDNGIKVFDVSDPLNLKLLNAIEDIPARDIIPLGDHMLIATTEGLKQYRYENQQLILLSEL